MIARIALLPLNTFSAACKKQGVNKGKTNGAVKTEANFEIRIDVKPYSKNYRLCLSSNGCRLCVNRSHTSLGRLAAHFCRANYAPTRK